MISFAGGLVLGYVVGSVITAVLIFGLWRARAPQPQVRDVVTPSASADASAASTIDLRDPNDRQARRRRGFHLHGR